MVMKKRMMMIVTIWGFQILKLTQWIGSDKYPNKFKKS